MNAILTNKINTTAYYLKINQDIRWLQSEIALKFNGISTYITLLWCKMQKKKNSHGNCDYSDFKTENIFNLLLCIFLDFNFSWPNKLGIFN